MTRKTFLTIAAAIALCVGFVALAFPTALLESVKNTTANAAAVVMTRTVGALLLAIGLLVALVRGHPDSPTLRAVLAANLVLQLAILPIDPAAYAAGTLRGLASFVPNTILHLFLAGGFAFFLSAHPGETAGD